MLKWNDNKQHTLYNKAVNFSGSCVPERLSLAECVSVHVTSRMYDFSR